MLRTLSRPKRILQLILAGLIIFVMAWLANRKRYDDHLLLTGIDGVDGQQFPNKMPNSSYLEERLIFNGSENAMQKAVVKEFLHAWNGYHLFAWGHDELKPVSRGWMDWMGVGLTIIDSLDTMYIMGLENEFALAREWIADNLSFDRDGDVSVFEITIRVLGGLLSAFHLSQDHVFLDKALLLGETLLPCFNVTTDKAIPCNRMNLRHRRPDFIDTSTAEAGTLQLELRDLSRSSGLVIYEKIADAISQHLHRLPKFNGLALKYITVASGQFRRSSALTVGGGVDSYYEYLLKQWIQTGKTRKWLKDDYLSAVEGIQQRLLRYTHPSQLAFLGSYHTIDPRSFTTNMEHLSCFLPGTLVLGVLHGINNGSHLALAANLTKTCYEMYRISMTGLSAESVSMNTDQREGKDIQLQWSNRRYVLRPETIESLFYMFVATGKEEYRNMAWTIFNSIRRYARVDAGYASVENVDSIDEDVDDNSAMPRHADQMETFFLAETLKYFYLIFADQPNKLLPLDRFVLNTEAHPLPIYST